MTKSGETSNKIPLSLDDLKDLERIANLKYATYIGERSFSISCSSDTHCSFVKIVLRSQDESFYYPVEARIEHLAQDLTSKESVLLVIDYIDTYFEEFLCGEENVFVPIDWTEFNFEGFSFSLRGQILNLAAESRADEILAGMQLDQAPQTEISGVDSSCSHTLDA